MNPWPREPGILWSYARVLNMLGEHDEALVYLQQLLDDGTRARINRDMTPMVWIRAHLEISRIFSKKGKNEKADYHAEAFSNYWKDWETTLDPKEIELR
jgi:hypothetical protein